MRSAFVASRAHQARVTVADAQIELLGQGVCCGVGIELEPDLRMFSAIRGRMIRRRFANQLFGDFVRSIWIEILFVSIRSFLRVRRVEVFWANSFWVLAAFPFRGLSSDGVVAEALLVKPGGRVGGEPKLGVAGVPKERRETHP